MIRWGTRLAGLTGPKVMLLFLCSGVASGADLKPETIAAWDSYVRLTEARIERELLSRLSATVDPATDIPVVSWSTLGPRGETVEAPFAMIHHWRGAVFIPNVTLDALIERLKHPETLPPQEDVLQSRVLRRTGDSLRLYLKLERRNIVKVIYDTEHDVTFRRLSATMATSRSVATKIAEVEDAGTPEEHERPAGGDHGFMWRLNAYWRYQRTGSGVLVELESLTLSRDIPTLIRPIAAPIVRSIARESMSRALDAVRRGFSAPAPSGHLAPDPLRNPPDSPASSWGSSSSGTRSEDHANARHVAALERIGCRVGRRVRDPSTVGRVSTITIDYARPEFRPLTEGVIQCIERACSRLWSSSFVSQPVSPPRNRKSRPNRLPVPSTRGSRS